MSAIIIQENLGLQMILELLRDSRTHISFTEKPFVQMASHVEV